MKSVTIRDVAQEAGVSIATVSRVLSGKNKVSEETRENISNAIRRTGYKLPLTADRSILQEDGFIYYIMRTASTNTYSLLLNKHLILAAYERDLRIISNNIEMKAAAATPFPEEEMLAALRQAVRIGARGVVISGFSENSMTPNTLQYLRDMEIPVVLIVRRFSDYSFNRVLTGSERGTFQATQHMLKTGRRHLMFVTLPGHRGKLSGFERAIHEFDGEEIKKQVAELPDDSYECCEAALEQALKEDPELDGILCVADEFAAHLQHKLLQMGRKLPQEIEIIGYNDNLAPYLYPPLSSIRVPLSQIAETVLDLIFEQEQNRDNSVCKSVMMDPQLVLR